MRYLLLIGIFLTNFDCSFAQVKPDFFPEDINPEAIGVRCFCKPGVQNKSRSRGFDFSYGILGSSTFEPEDDPLTRPFSSFRNVEQLEINAKFPILNKEHFKILLGYKYYRETLRFDNVGQDFEEVFRELSNQRLNSNSFSVIISKPIDETRYLAGRFRYSLNGDYEGWIKFGEKYRIYKFLAMYGIKPSEDLEWGFGLNVASGFRGNSVLPFILYNRNFNQKWGLEAILPGLIYGRYNLNSKNILLAGIEYSSQSYRLDVTESAFNIWDYAYNHSEIMIALNWEHQFSNWIWGDIKVGYQMNFSSDFEAKTDNTTPFNVEPTNNLFFKIGLFLSPPDDLIK